MVYRMELTSDGSVDFLDVKHNAVSTKRYTLPTGIHKK